MKIFLCVVHVIIFGLQIAHSKEYAEDKEVKEVFSSPPESADIKHEEILRYFTARFPKLLVHTWRVYDQWEKGSKGGSYIE